MTRNRSSRSTIIGTSLLRFVMSTILQACSSFAWNAFGQMWLKISSLRTGSLLSTGTGIVQNGSRGRHHHDGMKAILLDGFGGPERMRRGDAPDPRPAPGEVLIRIAATSVNRPDILQREGKYPPPPGASEILGLECSGTIEEIGADVRGF